MGGFKKAEPKQAFVKLGIYGASGSGKTFTSLLLGEGLAKLTGKRVGLVDTERGSDFYSQGIKERKIHPQAFDFDALYSRSITDVLDAVRTVDLKTHGVIIIDSLTHIWESAKAAYEGKTTRIGTIPLQAWGKIKKPYKDLINLLLSLPVHVIFCGRQGVDYKEDEDSGELKMAGYKMKSESETPYEPHILIRLECVRGKDIEPHPVAFVEKDRSSVLQGKSIENPSFDNIIKPILHTLSGTKQAEIKSIDEVAGHDAEKFAEEEIKKETKSKELLSKFSAQFDLAMEKTDVEKIAKSITSEIKSQMTGGDVTALKEKYLEALKKFK